MSLIEARLDYVTDEVVANVDVFGARVVLSAVSESDGPTGCRRREWSAR